MPAQGPDTTRTAFYYKRNQEGVNAVFTHAWLQIRDPASLLLPVTQANPHIKHIHFFIFIVDAIAL